MAGWGIAEGLERGVANFLQMQELGRQRQRDEEDRKRGILMQNLQWLGQWDEPTRQALIDANLDVFDPEFIVKAHGAAGGSVPGAGLLASAPGGEVSTSAPRISLRRPGEDMAGIQKQLAEIQLQNLRDETNYSDFDRAWNLGDDTLLNNIPDTGRRSWARGLGPDYFATRKLREQRPGIVNSIQASISSAKPGQEEAVRSSTIAGLDAAYGPGWREQLGIGKPHLEGPSAALLAPEPANPATNPMLGAFSDFTQNPALAEMFFPQRPFEERPETRTVDPALSNPLFQPLPQTAEQRLAQLGPVMQATEGIGTLHQMGVDPNDTFVLRQGTWQALQDMGLIPGDKPFRSDFLNVPAFTPAQEVAQNNAAVKMAIDAQGDSWNKQMDLARLGVSQGNLDLAREREERLASAPAAGADPNKRIYTVGNDMAKTLLGFGYNPNVSGIEARNNFQAMQRKGWIYMDPISKTYKPVVKREPMKDGKPGKVIKDYTDNVMHEIEVMNRKYAKQASGAVAPAASSNGTSEVLGYKVVGIGSNTPIHYGTHSDGQTFDVTENEARRRGKSLEQVAKEFVAQGYVVAVRKVGQRGIESNHLHVTTPGSAEAKRIAGQKGVLVPSSSRTASSSSYKAPDKAAVENDIRQILKKYPKAQDSQVLAALAESYGLRPEDFKGALGRVRKGGVNG